MKASLEIIFVVVNGSGGEDLTRILWRKLHGEGHDLDYNPNDDEEHEDIKVWYCKFRSHCIRVSLLFGDNVHIRLG